MIAELLGLNGEKILGVMDRGSVFDAAESFGIPPTVLP